MRWGDSAACPLCNAPNVGRKVDGHRVGRWNCHKCHSNFNVLSGTIFQKTKMPLQKWFLAISLTLNAKKSLSSYQLARDLGLNQKTVWYLLMRIRRAMVDEGDLLQGIIEAGEAYIGGKPRWSNRWEDHRPHKKGRGTDKLPILGAVELGGKVVAQPSVKVDGKAISDFLSQSINYDASLLITDAYHGYRPMRRYAMHAFVDHSERYVDGLAHTNTIEGFWSFLKRAWYGPITTIRS